MSKTNAVQNAAEAAEAYDAASLAYDRRPSEATRAAKTAAATALTMAERAAG